MQGKLIIPFHFHLDLMCQQCTPNLTTNCFTGESFEQKEKKNKKTRSSTSFLVTKTAGQEHEPLLTVNLNNKACFFFPFYFHHISVIFIVCLSAGAAVHHREYTMAKLIVYFTQFMGPSNCKNKYINHQNTLIDH